MVFDRFEMTESKTGTFEGAGFERRRIPTRTIPIITTPMRTKVPMTSETACVCTV
jgi:hypothetical protein